MVQKDLRTVQIILIQISSISYKPTNWLVVSFDPGVSKSFSELQYVDV